MEIQFELKILMNLTISPDHEMFQFANCDVCGSQKILRELTEWMCSIIRSSTVSFSLGWAILPISPMAVCFQAGSHEPDFKFAAFHELRGSQPKEYILSGGSRPLE
jgi:hypothetical protein